MKTSFRQSFLRDLKSVKDKRLLSCIREVIEEVEAAENLQDIDNVKKLASSKTAFRIRVGEYRLGLHCEKGVIEFVRCLDRKDLYRYFP